MRSQATKSIPKKGSSKSSLKSNTNSKMDKRKCVSLKKVKKLVKKNLVKAPKKTTLKDSNTDDEGISESKLIRNTSAAKASTPRSSSPVKKTKCDAKEKKQKPPVNSPKKTNNRKSTNQVRPEKNRKATTNRNEDDNVKYKLNSGPVKTNLKFSKAKTIVKKSTVQKKKSTKCNKNITAEQESESGTSENVNSNLSKENITVVTEPSDEIHTKNDKDEESKTSESSSRKSSTSTNPGSISLSPPKSENDRPHKFFTSTRSPRTVDIDVKSCKITKTNVSNSELLSDNKLTNRNDDSSKDKNNSCSQNPEFDVYTFTEKVDSPKNIISDFRNPVSKAVGRVRPVARVKATVIDKNKSDSEKKKYSPHRPIEEVVKQLKASKRPEELKASETPLANTSSITTNTNLQQKDQEVIEKPKVGKSYTMVNRKRIPGRPFSPILSPGEEPPKDNKADKTPPKSKKKSIKKVISDEEIETSTFSLNTKSKMSNCSSSDESVSESNDDTKDSSESEPLKSKTKNKRYKKTADSQRKKPAKELNSDSCDKDEYPDNPEKLSKRRRKLISMWVGPKRHRMASLNAIAKVHCLYENESRTHVELGLMKTVQPIPSTSAKSTPPKKTKETKLKDIKEIKQERESTSESEYERNEKYTIDSSEDDSSPPPQRKLRGIPGIRSAGKYWDPKSCTSSSEDSELDYKKEVITKRKSLPKPPTVKTDVEKPAVKTKKKAVSPPVKKKRNRTEVVMDLKDMVVQKRMASLNATAILAASYEKRSPKSSKDETTSDSCSDESFSHVPKNGTNSGVKSETKIEEPKKEKEDPVTDTKQKVEVVVNQDTDVTITGVYATHLHEGFCTVSGMQYRISSTSHTQTTATANCEKEGCTREEDGTKYAPLTALSSMQPPAEHAAHAHTVVPPELGGLTRRAAGCSSAFTAPPPPATHHEPGKMSRNGLGLYETIPSVPPIGYYQPAGPLIKESNDAERPLARYHPPPPHYHAPHAPQYGPYYPDLCYGRYYRPSGPYHVPPPPNPESQMMGAANEPYPPQFYGGPPCYQHSPQRLPYLEYRCPCPTNSCPKNVLIGPATGKAPAGGGPAELTSSLAPSGGVFRTKVRTAYALDMGAETHGSGKDPPPVMEPEPPAGAGAPQPLSGASPKRELLYDARDSPRLAGDTPGPAEAVGPPSPARGSAGLCAPQPPSVAPRRARLGKAMARRSLADTSSFLSTPAPVPPTVIHSDADDDVLAISPPACVPIDLSSSDETDRRSTPLLDVKKENEGPTCTSPRKPDTLALREHNSTEPLIETTMVCDQTKPTKRRYSRPKLEIDILDVELDEGCKTNGIGEHVKLQKRKKVTPDQTDVSRNNNNTEKIPKKKSAPKSKTVQKLHTTPEKKSLKKKNEIILDIPQTKKSDLESSLKNTIIYPLPVPKCQEQLLAKPKTKSALVLDNLIRKNSIDAKNYNSDDNINPAELFLSPSEHSLQNDFKKSLNINNNVVNNKNAVNGVRPKTIAAVTQLISKKLTATKISERILKSTDQSCKEDEIKNNADQKNEAETNKSQKNTKVKQLHLHSKLNAITDKLMIEANSGKSQKKVCSIANLSNTSEASAAPQPLETDIPKQNETPNVAKITDIEVIEDKTKEDTQIAEKGKKHKPLDKDIPEKVSKRSKLAVEKLKIETKEKAKEKMTKLFVFKKFVIKTDEPTLVVEEACGSPILANTAVRRTRRRRSGTIRKPRRVPTLLAPPVTDASREPPRWCNGWNWGGDNFLSKIYINNDGKLDRMARCWSHMTHTSGDRVMRGDCVLLRASSARAQPFVAKVAHLWENPEDGEMMVSLVWYYRPEHTHSGRQKEDAPDEVFASRHRDANSVACIEDKCYVLTYNEYCRYRKRLKAAEEGICNVPSIVPPMPPSEITPQVATNDSKMPPSVSSELVLFCRKVYDFRSKRIQGPNK